jgi:hypothetical protein
MGPGQGQHPGNKAKMAMAPTGKTVTHHMKDIQRRHSMARACSAVLTRMPSPSYTMSSAATEGGSRRCHRECLSIAPARIDSVFNGLRASCQASNDAHYVMAQLEVLCKSRRCTCGCQAASSGDASARLPYPEEQTWYSTKRTMLLASLLAACGRDR